MKQHLKTNVLDTKALQNLKELSASSFQNKLFIYMSSLHVREVIKNRLFIYMSSLHVREAIKSKKVILSLKGTLMLVHKHTKTIESRKS